MLPASVQQMPPAACQGNSSPALSWRRQQLPAARPVAAVTARLSVWGAAVVSSASPCNNCLDLCSRCRRSIFSSSCRQMGKSAAILRCGGRLKPSLVRWGGHGGAQNPDPAVTPAEVRLPCKDFGRASLPSHVTVFCKHLLGLSWVPGSLAALQIFSC